MERQRSDDCVNDGVEMTLFAGYYVSDRVSILKFFFWAVQDICENGLTHLKI